MKEFNFPEIFQNKLRLEIVSCLISGEKSFRDIKDLTNASDGNISAQISKLKKENVVSVKKEFINNKPKTTYTLTDSGLNEFENYVSLLQSILESETK